MAFWTMWTLSSSVGAMLTAASVMISGVSWPGTSMTKQWLMRRAVRRPPSRRTTAPISSSVCRLPFISASASPARTSSTALAGGVMAVLRHRRGGNAERSAPEVLRGGRDLRERPDQDRLDQAELRRLEDRAEGGRVAGMGDGHLQAGKFLRGCDQLRRSARDDHRGSYRHS